MFKIKKLVKKLVWRRKIAKKLDSTLCFRVVKDFSEEGFYVQIIKLEEKEALIFDGNVIVPFKKKDLPSYPSPQICNNVLYFAFQGKIYNIQKGDNQIKAIPKIQDAVDLRNIANNGKLIVFKDSKSNNIVFDTKTTIEFNYTAWYDLVEGMHIFENNEGDEYCYYIVNGESSYLSPKFEESIWPRDICNSYFFINRVIGEEKWQFFFFKFGEFKVAHSTCYDTARALSKNEAPAYYTHIAKRDGKVFLLRVKEEKIFEEEIPGTRIEALIEDIFYKVFSENGVSIIQFDKVEKCFGEPIARYEGEDIRVSLKPKFNKISGEIYYPLILIKEVYASEEGAIN